MIMRPGQQLLLPANPLFIWGSLLLALVANMLPLGRVPWMPDIVAVVLTRADRKLTGAAVFQHGVATALPGVPGPDDLMQ